jgi:hypothetical protein
VLRHLPDERDWDHMDRKWLADILYTVDRVSFERIIKDAVKARRDRLEEKNDMNVVIRPEFAQAFQSCMSFSSKIRFSSEAIYSGEGQSLTHAQGLLKA